MSYFFEELDFLAGGRFTSLSHMTLRQWPMELDHEIVLFGQFVLLPPGQHVDVEEDFLASHLPYHRAMFGGLNPADDPWLFSIQGVPRPVVWEVWGADADPRTVMRNAVLDALTYNAGAEAAEEGWWDRDSLLSIFAQRGVDPGGVWQWPTFDLLRGLLAELTGVSLAQIAAGYPECAFPGHIHACRHDVFEDAFTAWAARGA